MQAKSYIFLYGSLCLSTCGGKGHFWTKCGSFEVRGGEGCMEKRGEEGGGCKYVRGKG